MVFEYIHPVPGGKARGCVAAKRRLSSGRVLGDRLARSIQAALSVKFASPERWLSSSRIVIFFPLGTTPGR